MKIEMEILLKSKQKNFSSHLIEIDEGGRKTNIKKYAKRDQ